MLWKISNQAVLGGLAFALGSCGMADGKRDTAALPAPPPGHSGTQGNMVQDFPVKIGNPYQIGGTTYVPADALTYDEVGYASWYGEEAGGKATANGETFLPGGASAAHKTLPLPSYVEVTALDTGRTILVRVNDRGPFANDRLIDLSRGAAEQLGITGAGSAAVRVRRVNPPEQERAILRSGGKAAERLETPNALLSALRNRLGSAARSMPVPKVANVPAPKAAPPAPSVPRKAVVAKTSTPPSPVQAASPKTATVPHGAPSSDPFIVEQVGAPAPAPHARPSSGLAAAPAGYPAGFIVQAAAFASRERAEATAQRLGASVAQVGGLWRVRYGPYPTQAAAQAGVQRAAAAGFNGARIMVNE